MLKRWLILALKAALSIALIVWVFRKVDLGEAWARGSDIAPAMLAAAFGAMLLQVFAGALRWVAVIRAIGGRMDIGKGFALFYVGNFLNTILPGGAVGGDAARMWLGQRHGLILGTAVRSVLMERGITVLGIMLLVTLSWPLLAQDLGDLSDLYLWIFPLGLLACLGGILVIMALDRLPVWLHRFKPVAAMLPLAADMRAVFLSWRNSLWTVGLAVFGHLNIALVVWLLALGMGIQPPLLDFLLIIQPVMFLVTLPVSLGGWGVREGGLMVALAHLGIAPHIAFVISVVYGFVNILANLPGGLIWLAVRDQTRPGTEGEVDSLSL